MVPTKGIAQIVFWASVLGIIYILMMILTGVEGNFFLDILKSVFKAK